MYKIVSYQALNPLWSELHGLEGKLGQACSEASTIWSIVILALQMFAMERICFIPYWDRDPQCFSNVLTIVLRQIQSSTRGCPVGRTVLKTCAPFSIPKISFATRLMLSSKWLLCDIASISCCCAAFFLDDPSGALSNYIQSRKQSIIHENIMIRSFK